MCGIVGYAGSQDALSILLDCLGRLEYRGYDSAGIGIIENGRLRVCRSVGKNSELRKLLDQDPVRGTIGITHTRWATHGKPSLVNAHPHVDCSGAIAIVHNGIIENYEDIKRKLEMAGHRFSSQTDSEVIAHLFETDEDIEYVARKTLPTLEGAYALAVLSEKSPERILVARNGGPPIVIGYSDTGCFVASDITAILQYTRDVRTLEDGEMAILDRNDVRLIRFDGKSVRRAATHVPWDVSKVDKAGFPHFMLKEIHEQPEAIINTIQGQKISKSGKIGFPWGGILNDVTLTSVHRISIVACGTSWHAALVGKYILEFLTRTPVTVDVASEYRYRPHIFEKQSLVIGISQSGETADTLGAIKEARRRGARVLSICNVPGSGMTRESDGVIYTHAGPEIGVASTKSFTCQLVSLILFALYFGECKGMIVPEEARKLLDELLDLPRLIGRILERENELASLAALISDFPNMLYLGRGINYPLAVEGALKLKEISYIHAEGYPAGEMKHGPIALIDKHMPVIVIATMDRLYGKTLATIEEVRAREGIVIALANEGDTKIAARADQVIYLPAASELLTAVLVAVPLQLLAYHIAIQRGCDVDKPRNLAKSVTVE